MDDENKGERQSLPEEKKLLQEKDEFFDPIPEIPAPAPYAAAAPAPTGKSKAIKIVCSVFLALVFVAIGFTAGWLGYYYSLDERMRNFLWAKDTADKNFYKEIDQDAFYEKIFSALDLDPYSCYYTPEEFEIIMQEGEGQNEGVGVALTDEIVGGKTLPLIALLVENSPAQKAGIRKGMHVYGFGKTAEAELSGNTDALIVCLSEITGDIYVRCGYTEAGAQVYKLRKQEYQAAFCYYRDSEKSYGFRGDKKLSLTETHDPLTGADGKTAYIRLDEFSGNAAEEFAQCLALMKERGRENLIIDLRTNGGGYLTILQEIAAHLMRNAEGSKPVVATSKYRNGRTERYAATANDFASYFGAGARGAVLADEGTASASECLIGALVDYGTVSYGDIYLRKDAATGVARSYGKGIMQSHYPNASGGVMKLTVAEIFWPNGRSIHGVGVTEKDGCVGIEAPLVWGERDGMLAEVLAKFCG